MIGLIFWILVVLGIIVLFSGGGLREEQNVLITLAGSVTFSVFSLVLLWLVSTLQASSSKGGVLQVMLVIGLGAASLFKFGTWLVLTKKSQFGNVVFIADAVLAIYLWNHFS